MTEGQREKHLTKAVTFKPPDYTVSREPLLVLRSFMRSGKLQLGLYYVPWPLFTQRPYFAQGYVGQAH